ncbi:MAG: O-antigen ligase family protein [Ruminococcus sp.]|nr:O-antigen ligase family protein [Ruminococcus sp.]
MKNIRSKIIDSSLFRRYYVITLYLTNIAFIQIPAISLAVLLFIWGAYLVYYNQKEYNTLFKLRFGLWIGSFLGITLLSIMLNFSVTILYSLLMFAHISICFSIFYGLHTEPDLDFRKELYFIAKVIVYMTTIFNVIGIVCLMCGFSFEWYWVKFTIYENRFTGVFVNPNILGFITVVAMFCCHMLYKNDFVKSVKKSRISRIWIISCGTTSFFSLMLCDSNASMVLALGYIMVYLAYCFFADKIDISRAGKTVSKSKIFIKIVALMLLCCFLCGSVLVFRVICQAGFSTIVSKSTSLISVVFNGSENDTIIADNSNSSGNIKKNSLTSNSKNNSEVSFNHENSNIDSGRFKLWAESYTLFRISPIIGISNGNIVMYSEEYANGVLSYSYHNSDLHNGFLTLLVSSGVIGFIVFCIFGFRFAKHSAQHLFLQKNTFRNDIYPCMFAFLSAYLLYALFEKALLYDVSFMVIWFWLIMGYLSCYIMKFEPMLETQYLFHKKQLTRTLL